MAVPAAKVKAVCTKSEVELIRSSRSPRLGQLSLAEVKKSKERARKLFDKWVQQSRKQSRSQSRSKGVADEDSNTRLKADIFREALDSFDARQRKLESQGGKSSAKAAATTMKQTPSKKKRAASNREKRAAIRGELAETSADMNRGKPKKKKAPAKKAASPGKRPAGTRSAAVISKKKAAVLTSLPASASAAKAPESATGKPSKQKQLRAKTVAKQTRIAESGKTSRILGHVSARGKRAQARRDSSGRQ